MCANKKGSGGGGTMRVAFLTLTLALVAVLSISLAFAALQTYYLIRTGHGGNDVVQTAPEGGSTTFKIKFQARHVPHSTWDASGAIGASASNCIYIPTAQAYANGCYLLITGSRRIRPVIQISSPTDATAHGWTTTTSSYPTTATAAWDHEGHQIEVYQYGHNVTVTATASNDSCKGPQTSTFTASIVNANASNAVLAEKTYTLRKTDNDPLSAACT